VADTLRSLLPELYQPLLPELFDTLAPAEPKATCGSCAMCPPKDAPAPSAEVTYFRPDTKCCTFEPRLPSYLVGAILADERPDLAEGRRRIRAKIAARVGVTPQWLAPPAKREVLFGAAWRNAFGRSLLFLCPYYERDHGLCTIWRHREAVCSTFFCKYDAAADGERFWKSVRGVVGYVELVVSRHVTQALIPGYTGPVDRGLTLEDLEDKPPREEAYAALWGAWVGREEELYREAYERVRGLDRAGFRAILEDAEYAKRGAAMTAAHRTLESPSLPERLAPSPTLDARPAEGGVLVATYSRYEPLLLTEALHEVVQAFGGGGTVAEVRERLLREQEIDVPEELLQSLYQYRVLVEPESPR
jgi:Fe-S-cluster containining protein